MCYTDAFVAGGRCAYGLMSGVIERPRAAAAGCQFGDVLLQDALLCQRLPIALCNAGIHPLSVVSAPIHPLPSVPEAFDS